MSRRCMSKLAGPDRKVGQRRDGQTLEAGRTPVYQPRWDPPPRVLADEAKYHGWLALHKKVHGQFPRHALRMQVAGFGHLYRLGGNVTP